MNLHETIQAFERLLTNTIEWLGQTRWLYDRTGRKTLFFSRSHPSRDSSNLKTNYSDRYSTISHTTTAAPHRLNATRSSHHGKRSQEYLHPRPDRPAGQDPLGAEHQHRQAQV